MARKLYAVTSGEEDGYHIITLTKSRRRAEKIAEIYDADVEEYEDSRNLTKNPATYLVRAYGTAKCCEKFDRYTCGDIEKGVIFEHGFAYVDAWSKKEAEQKADVIFKEVREKEMAEQKAQEEEYRSTPT